MRSSSLRIFWILLGLIIFDFGLLHLTTSPATGALYGALGSALFAAIALILSTLLKYKGSD